MSLRVSEGACVYVCRSFGEGAVRVENSVTVLVKRVRWSPLGESGDALGSALAMEGWSERELKGCGCVRLGDALFGRKGVSFLRSLALVEERRAPRRLGALRGGEMRVEGREVQGEDEGRDGKSGKARGRSGSGWSCSCGGFGFGGKHNP